MTQHQISTRINGQAAQILLVAVGHIVQFIAPVIAHDDNIALLTHHGYILRNLFHQPRIVAIESLIGKHTDTDALGLIDCRVCLSAPDDTCLR
ncbi:hypothetical protein SDC9_161521 [bioreactor metagenome]|uniref:Uncharacterized protein n=1 Tax=bioreactor metagenome TaxID=1076179 RepID=A0A645FIE7_9ZZZZ